MEDGDQSHYMMEDRNSAASLGLSDDASYANISTPPRSMSNKLRRSTFDLSSVNSLATSVSDSSNYCASTPTRKPSTLRYRGLSSSSGNPASLEAAPKQSPVQRGRHDGSNSSVREAREKPMEDTQSGNERTTKHCSHEMVPGTISTKESQSGWLGSMVQYFLEVIVLGCLFVPFLEFTIRIERWIRGKFEDIHRSTGNVFTSLFAPSSSFHDEPIGFESEKFCCMPYAPMLQHYQQQLFDGNIHNEDVSGLAVSCNSTSSSSSEGETIDEDGQVQDGWGHFTDFQDELADEASFVPSCSVGGPLRISVALPPSSGVSALETLAEGREEDDDAGEEWTF